MWRPWRRPRPSGASQIEHHDSAALGHLVNLAPPHTYRTAEISAIMRRLLKYGFLLLVLLGIAASAYAAWSRFRPSQFADPREQTFISEVSRMEDVLVVAGQVKPAVTIDLRAEASGIVEHVAV